MTEGTKKPIELRLEQLLGARINLDMRNEQKCYNTGKMFAESIDVETHKIGELHYVCISWGDNYYETDRYNNRGQALSEAKGYLHGLAEKLETEIHNLEQQED